MMHYKVLAPQQRRGERGMSLLEVLIALAIMAIAAVAFLAGLTTTSQAVMVSQRHVTLESLAKSQMEYIKRQPYDAVNIPPQYLRLPAADIPAGYTILPVSGPILGVRLDPKDDGTGNDDGIQRVTVTVRHVDAAGRVTSFAVSGYKRKEE